MFSSLTTRLTGAALRRCAIQARRKRVAGAICVRFKAFSFSAISMRMKRESDIAAIFDVPAAIDRKWFCTVFFSLSLENLLCRWMHRAVNIPSWDVCASSRFATRYVWLYAIDKRIELLWNTRPIELARDDIVNSALEANHFHPNGSATEKKCFSIWYQDQIVMKVKQWQFRKWAFRIRWKNAPLIQASTSSLTLEITVIVFVVLFSIPSLSLPLARARAASLRSKSTDSRHLRRRNRPKSVGFVQRTERRAGFVRHRTLERRESIRSHGTGASEAESTHNVTVSVRPAVASLFVYNVNPHTLSQTAMHLTICLCLDMFASPAPIQSEQSYTDFRCVLCVCVSFI